MKHQRRPRPVRTSRRAGTHKDKYPPEADDKPEPMIDDFLANPGRLDTPDLDLIDTYQEDS